MIKDQNSYLKSEPNFANGEDLKQKQIESLKSEKKIKKITSFQKSYLYRLMGLKLDEMNSLEDDENDESISDHSIPS